MATTVLELLAVIGIVFAVNPLPAIGPLTVAAATAAQRTIHRVLRARLTSPSALATRLGALSGEATPRPT